MMYINEQVSDYEGEEMKRIEYFDQACDEGMKKIIDASQLPVFWNWFQEVLKENAELGGCVYEDILSWYDDLKEQELAAVVDDDYEFWHLIEEDKAINQGDSFSDGKCFE